MWIDLAGVRTKVFLFTMRLSFSGKAVHRAYATQGQEAFLEGHQSAFEVFGGTPMFHIRYDNLKAAVSRVLFGRTRTESTRWVAFRSHYGFESFYCHAGVEGAHEKGGVEGEGGRFRRNHLVPVPKVESIAELNALLSSYDLADDARRISNRTMSVGQHYAFEATLLRPLPTKLFETGLALTPRVDRYARVTVRQCHYSVPARLIGHRVRGVLRASELVLFDGRKQVARHERATVRGSEVLVLDHYLEVLVRKPGALRGATALVQARAAGTFTNAHEAFWAAARKNLGDGGGTRALVEVLLLHRHHDHADVVAGITAALLVGAVSPDVVALETRKHAPRTGGPGASTPSGPGAARPSAGSRSPCQAAFEQPAPDGDKVGVAKLPPREPPAAHPYRLAAGAERHQQRDEPDTGSSPEKGGLHQTRHARGAATGR